jgi:hypothetical protein
MSSIKLLKAPDAEPVTVAVVKNHLRITISQDDALLAIYLQAAREIVESESGRSLVNKGYLQSHDQFPRRRDLDHGAGYWYAVPRYAHHRGDRRQEIKLLRSPLVRVDKITYVDTAGALQTLLPVAELWQPDTEYVIGDQVKDSNGNLQEVTAVAEAAEDATSKSGSSAPTWSLSVSTTTTDQDLTWTCRQVPAPTGDFLIDQESEPPSILPLFGQVWPATQHVPNAVRVYFTAGYGNDGKASPATLRLAVMQAVGVSYEFREAVTAEELRELDWYDRLIWSERVLDWDPTK